MLCPPRCCPRCCCAAYVQEQRSQGPPKWPSRMVFIREVLACINKKAAYMHANPEWGYTKRDAALCLRMQAFIIKIRVSLKEMQHWRSHDHLLLKCEAAPERRIREMPPSSEELRNRDIRTVVQESPLALVLGIQGHSITETCDEIQLEIPP